MKSILLFVGLTLATLSTFAHAADVPRVAVVPDSADPMAESFGDLLTVSLGKVSDRFELVERAALDKLAAERQIQELAADQRPAAIAKLANADGLIIVGTDLGDPKLPKFTLRLTSTNNGLVLRSLALGGKEAEFAQAAELAAGVLRFSCERLTHGDVKPPLIISLLGIRPAFEVDRALETTLNLAVSQQLSAQSGIAVSERWRMNDLVFEKSLTAAEQPAFVTGSILLDGSYTRKGDELEVTLRLRDAEVAAGKKCEIKGSVAKPEDLARLLARRVATETGQTGEAVAWDTIQEGKEYADLGWWLFARNLCEESARALESAMALGNRHGSVLRNRMWAYSGMIELKPAYAPARTEVDGWDRLPKDQFKTKVLAAIRATQSANELLDVNFGGLTAGYTPSNRNSNLRAIFVQNLKVLQALCMRGEQLELATEARTLRALSRDLVAKGEAALHNSFVAEVSQRFYIHDTPEQAAAELRSLLDPKRLGNEPWNQGRWLRGHLWQTYHDPSLWRFVDWAATDNRRGDAAWKAFISELRTSKLLLHRVDSLAFAFQISRSDQDKEDILRAYCDLMESNLDELLTPDGQKCFFAFDQYHSSAWKSGAFPAFEQRFARLLVRVFERAAWVEPATILIASHSVTNWNYRKIGEPVPEADALELLNAVENYIKRAKSLPGWKQQYQNRNYDTLNKDLEDITEKIILPYPRLKELRIKARPVVAGAVPIRAWKPEGPGLSDSKNWLFGEAMISSGDSLFVPMINQGIIDLNVRTMSVSRVMGLPLPGCRFIGGLATNRTSMMIQIQKQLFTCPLSGDGRIWSEIVPPGVTKQDALTWCICGWDEEFFVGSCIANFEAKSPRMLAGMVRGGKLEWLASSNRRPELNPLDRMDPKSTLLAYRNGAGKTMVLLGGFSKRAPLVELETGREVTAFADHAVTQMRGDMPLFWEFGTNPTDRRIRYIFACDPAQDQPRLLLRTELGSSDLPPAWKGGRPVHDAARTEFQGNCIAAIVHGGSLWLFKREFDVLGESVKNDPQAFRLVRAPLDGSQPVSIPLRYDVPENIRNLVQGKREQASLERPVINCRSLTTTSKGLFFASSGNDNVHWMGDRALGGDLAPVLLYITWDDINAWLSKNEPETAKPDSP